MPITFIHSADFHLGAPLSRYGTWAAQKIQTAQFDALAETLAHASRHKVDFVLICGDLVDNRSPNRSVIDRFCEIVMGHAGLPIFVLPGTHDFLGEDSLFDSCEWATPFQNLNILNDAFSSPICLASANCHLYFKPNRANRSSGSPIAGLIRSNDPGFHVGLAHGSVAVGGLDVSNDFPITLKEIENSGLDYMALGHWHKPKVFQSGSITAAYSGVPQPISFGDPENGSVSLVTIDDSRRVSITPLVVSTVKFRVISKMIYHPAEAKELLEKSADPQTVLKIDLSYSDNFNEFIKVEQIINQVAERYLVISKENKGPAPSLPQPHLLHRDDNPPLLLAYLSELQRLKEADTPERGHLYDRAAEIGSAIIREAE